MFDTFGHQPPSANLTWLRRFRNRFLRLSSPPHVVTVAPISGSKPMPRRSVAQAIRVSLAASATSKGIEGSLSLFPFRNFDITASGAYQDIKYDD